MSKQLQDKVAIVTGASNGIGRGIAETFAAEGARTVLVARRAQLLDEVASGIRSRGGEALPVPADLTQEAAITALFATVTKTYGRLDVLVNNAGVATHINTEDITLEYWREVLDINITAPFLCSREASPHHEGADAAGRAHHQHRQRLGQDAARRIRCPTRRPSSALQGMTHQLTMDGRKHNIVSSIIHPGATLSLVHDAPRARRRRGPGRRPTTT